MNDELPVFTENGVLDIIWVKQLLPIDLILDSSQYIALVRKVYPRPTKRLISCTVRARLRSCS
jgi:hypothetical protein